MVPMEVEDEFLKTEVPTVVMYHKSFKHCEAEEAVITGLQNIWSPPPPQYAIQDMLLQNGVGSKETEIL